MSTTHPYFARRRPPAKQEENFAGDGSRIDLTHAHLDAFGESDPVTKAAAQFDDRAAALVRSVVGLRSQESYWPRFGSEGQLLQQELLDAGLLELHTYYEFDAGPVISPTMLCLALLAYPDYFPATESSGRLTVSKAINASGPGWCGTFGPGMDAGTDFLGKKSEGNYDMALMHLLPIAYRYYDELTPDAREHLITQLLARGRVHGPGQDDTFTSGPYPEYWSRAGFVSPLGQEKRIGETENHILMIMTARYLSNQLLYQRNRSIEFDNRRNAPQTFLRKVEEAISPPKDPVPGSCTRLLLDLLQQIIRDDFSEYNAKPYQRETRWALLNLSNYAYDHEVRLGATMVLDYMSAHFAVSSNDLRRMIPFRRRNESEPQPKNGHDADGFMTTGLIDWQDGADPMGAIFGLLSGNVRVYEQQRPFEQDPARKWTWGIRNDGDSGDQLVDMLADYRIPPVIHDLLVNDKHRRFYQRLHRTRKDEVGGARNADNMEIFAGSPSYLISAGGAPAPWAIDPVFMGRPRGDYEQQFGVAVTTSFMPTTNTVTAVKADELIQFASFSQTEGVTANYGVAPDFACGEQMRLPHWVMRLAGTFAFVVDGFFRFINHKSSSIGPRDRPGFYLAIYQQTNGFALLEAFDTWLYPDLTFQEFQAEVKRRNPALDHRNNPDPNPIPNGQPFHYQTVTGTQIDFLITEVVNTLTNFLYRASTITSVKYGAPPEDAIGDAGNMIDKFLNGTVMNSTNDAIVDITNPFYGEQGSKITLDMSDALHPKRISENGEIEQAGSGGEVWLDFEWPGPFAGDAFRPFNRMADANAAVANGGVIKMIPSQTRERIPIGAGKRMRLTAPIGGVRIGVL